MPASKTSVNPGRIIAWIAVALAVALAAGFVYVNFIATPAVSNIASITFDQSKAVPDFDGSEYVIDDADDLAAFEELLDEHNVVPGVYFPSQEADCTGGTGTNIAVTYADGEEGALSLYDCGDVDAFTEEATEFFSEYRNNAS